jgi:catechol 2,3-dioxygenase-like lactoylglutathione lyase family enzyme
MKKPIFKAGNNIAVKTPSHEFEKVVHFYKTILGLEQIDSNSIEGYVTFKFGDKNLWIDNVPTISQSEIWLEIQTENHLEARRYFEEQGYAIRNEIEPLPEHFKGFWLNGPSNIIHLISE